MSTFREDSNANRKLQLEIQNQGKKKNKTETYSRQLSNQAKKTKSNKTKDTSKRYGRAPKGYIKSGSKFVSLRTAQGKRALNRLEAKKRAQEMARKRRLRK